MRILKWLGYALVVLIMLAGILAILNWNRLVRLNAVNTLFSEEKIVSNFSGMRNLFFHTEIPSSGEVATWQSSPKALPETFVGSGGERSLGKWLEESATTALLVVQDGKVAHESYYLGTNADDLRISWSVAKSFLSAAFGVAVGEGKIELTKPVDHYVPALANSNYKSVTVRNVLNMASGVKFNEDYLDFWSDINKMGRVLALGGSMDEFARSLEGRVREQGIARQYVSIDTHILAMVLRAATNKTIPEYLAEKIITPLGFEERPYYITDSEGNAFALGGLNVTTRDYARFGQMYLDNGKWQGRQIVPAGWVVTSTLKSAPEAAKPDHYDYGYQWWIPWKSVENGGDFLARGIYGQYIYINPRTRTVIVRNGANRKFREILVDDRNAGHIHVDMFRAIAEAVSK
ncbi:MAG: serine hydrolase domain-containing protein [Rhizobiaceae bacterium]